MEKSNSIFVLTDYLRVVLNESCLEPVGKFPRSILVYIAIESRMRSFKHLKRVTYALESGFVPASELGTGQIFFGTMPVG